MCISWTFCCLLFARSGRKECAKFLEWKLNLDLFLLKALQKTEISIPLSSSTGCKQEDYIIDFKDLHFITFCFRFTLWLERNEILRIFGGKGSWPFIYSVIIYGLAFSEDKDLRVTLKRSSKSGSMSRLVSDHLLYSINVLVPVAGTNRPGATFPGHLSLASFETLHLLSSQSRNILEIWRFSIFVYDQRLFLSHKFERLVAQYSIRNCLSKHMLSAGLKTLKC